MNRFPNSGSCYFAYVPQPHHCFHETERDRLWLQVNNLQNTIKNLKTHNDYLYFQLQKKRRKPRHRNVKRARFHIAAPIMPNTPPSTPENTHLSQEEVKNKLTDIFQTLNTLPDIIALENEPYASELKQNSKFAKLHAIIPTVKALNDLVGLEQVKSEAFEMIAFYTQIKVGKHQHNGLVHLVIKGPPGVGKTTTARLFGKLILGLGVLKNDNFIEARRSDLIGEYLGQTAPKTQKVIDSALGGVLFIDEGSALGHSDGKDSFAKESIDTLNQNLTEHKGEFLCIVAGYSNELEVCFFQTNRGLKRRFRSIEIKNYTFEQLHVIFEQKIKAQQWTLIDSSKSLAFFKEKHRYFYYFGGDVESLFDRAKFVAAGRMVRTSLGIIDSPLLLQSDIETAYNQCFKSREKQDESLSMYS
jgi:stage V sporulation protein K